MYIYNLDKVREYLKYNIYILLLMFYIEIQLFNITIIYSIIISYIY